MALADEWSRPVATSSTVHITANPDTHDINVSTNFTFTANPVGSWGNNIQYSWSIAYENCSTAALVLTGQNISEHLDVACGNAAISVIAEDEKNNTANDTYSVVVHEATTPPSVHLIQSSATNPSTILVGQLTTVNITAKINPVPDLLPASVTLQRLDDNNNVIANLGQLYDDGTHGDALPGDSIFTTQVSFNETNQSEIRLRISVSYSSPPSPVYSDIFTVDVLALPSQAAVNEVLSADKEASNNFDGWSQTYGIDKARQMVIDSLKANPHVNKVALSPDGGIINIIYDSGLEAALLTGVEGTDGMPDSNLGIVATSLYSDPKLSTNAECNYINNKLNDGTCVKSTIFADSAFTLETVKNLDDKGVIFIHTHGGMLGIFSNVVGILTGEEASTILGIPTSHLGDWILGRVEPVTVHGKSYWAFKPSYITSYATSFPHSLVVISACDSLKNDGMANAFLSKGAATYVGWTQTVNRAFAININQVLFDRLATGKTLKQAFDDWTLAQRTDPTIFPENNGEHAVYDFREDGSFELPKERVTNGGFETSDISGWTAGFSCCGDSVQYGSPGGYAVVIGGNVKDGNYSLRLGRWDQVYTQGLNGQPQPGTEPSGYDWVYQDVKVPSNGTPTLTFSYNIQTYDIAKWDWFDMFIKDPNTSENLATVVSHDGKPGSDYGTYWNGGWKDISFDLTPWKGQTIRLWFGNRQDGWGDQNAVFIDKVSIPCS